MKKPQALIGLLAALGTVIGVLVAVVGLPYGRADYTAFATLYHGPTNTVGTVHMALDCNTATPADDTGCNVLLTGGAQTTTVDVTVGNSTALARIISSYNFTVVNPDTTRLDAVTPGACAPPKQECNPDFLDSTESPQGQTGANWSCDPVLADVDLNNANGDDSLLSCLNIVDATSLAAGPGHLDLGRVTYDVPIAAAVGSVVLTVKNVNVFDESITELMSCNPISTNEGPCFSTTINFIPPPPSTSTPTATNTPLATSTPVPPTPIPDPGLQKDCDADALGIQTNCNLWICTPDNSPAALPDGPADGDCDGPGEGELRVVEVGLNIQSDDDNDGLADINDPYICTNPGPDLANNTADDIQCISPDSSNVELGLGAYEFSVEYDNFVIESVNPCDIVFGPTGEGVLRGPVDELNSSLPENADCNPDPDDNTSGQCTNSIITENIVHFGCVTVGSTPTGPASTSIGDQINIASLVLIPHEDLNNDLFPGNNNGVLTVIKDNGCELVDIFGHPVLGSINGGLTPFCGDLAVTVRILEGDIDLNCTVNNADAQAIAVRYGGFFGSLVYSKWFDLEPQFHDLDIDIKDIQKVFGRIGSTCQTPVPAQQPLPPPTGFGN